MHHLQYIFPGGRYPCHMPRPVWLVCTEVPNEVNLVVSPTTQRSLLVYRLPTFFFFLAVFSKVLRSTTNRWSAYLRCISRG